MERFTKNILMEVSLLFVISCFAISIYSVASNGNISNFHINLPPDHLIRYLNTFPSVLEECRKYENCTLPLAKIKTSNISAACWGYEKTCTPANRFNTPICPGDHTGWVQSKEAQVNTFFYQTDFGYLQQQINELSLMCEPTYLEDSSLECTKYLRFCRGRNLMFDFRNLAKRKDLIRYNMDVLKQGEIGGYCQLNKTRLMAETEHMGALQSWAPELQHFEELSYRPIANSKCDLIIEKPTYIMKIDANYNMYHHFCDFFNLYASIFVNQSHPTAFNTNTQILIWETYKYESPFGVTFKAFTDYPVWNLNKLKGKIVCFKNVVLPLLPRMIFGLYYNTPIIYGCKNSGLFRAFSEFILHRLQIPKNELKDNSKVRITFLSRKTKYRQVINEYELIHEIEKNHNYIVKRVSFDRGFTFIEQLSIIRNTDVLIGMHGAGLTHLIFLPNWASIFELYNCEDANCYKDLARLRGLKYITWTDANKVIAEDEGHHPQGGAHAKFTNYKFDRLEFVKLVDLAANHVLNHPEFIASAKAQKDNNMFDKSSVRNEL